MIAMIGWPEILIVCLVVVLLFGASSIPKLARGLGKAKKEFEKGRHEAEKDDAADGSAESSSPKAE